MYSSLRRRSFLANDKLIRQSLDGQIAAGARSRRFSKETVPQRYDAYIKARLGTRRLDSITRHDVGAVLADVAKAGKSKSVGRSVHGIIGAVLTYSTDQGWVRANVARGLPKSLRPAGKEERQVFVPTPEQVALVIEKASKGTKTLFLLLSETGLRSGEALGLRWMDFDKTLNVLHVEAQVEKGGTARVPLKTRGSRRQVPVTAKLRAALIAHEVASGHSRPSDFIFCSEGGRPLLYTNVRRCLTNATKRAKLTEVVDGRVFGLHALRHFHATQLILENVDAGTVARLLGHSGTSLLFDRYSDAFEKARQAGTLHTRIEAALGGGRS